MSFALPLTPLVLEQSHTLKAELIQEMAEI